MMRRFCSCPTPPRLSYYNVARWIAVACLALALAAVFFQPYHRASRAYRPLLNLRVRLFGPASRRNNASATPSSSSFLNGSFLNGIASVLSLDDLKWDPWGSSGSDPEPVRPSGENRGEYYSIGRVRNYTGDINLPGELQKMAEARSYKREIVMLLGNAGSGGSSDEIYPRFAIAAIVNMKKVGIQGRDRRA